MNNTLLDQLTEICLNNNTDCTAVKQADIVYDAGFRDACEQNTCGLFGNCYMCPPDIGGIEDLIQDAQTYPRGILYRTVWPLHDSFDFEGMMEAKKNHVRAVNTIEEEIRSLPLKRYLHLGVGGCGICDVCAKKEGNPCRFPEAARPSLEAYGVFVSETAKNVGLGYINGKNTVSYFSMILYEE